MMTLSGRRSTAISRSSHSILRKAGFVKTAAAFPPILRLPEFWSLNLGLLRPFFLPRHIRLVSPSPAAPRPPAGARASRHSQQTRSGEGLLAERDPSSGADF